MVGDDGVNVVTCSRKEGHQPTQAEPHDADLPGCTLQLSRSPHGRDDVPDTGIAIVGGVERETSFSTLHPTKY